MSTLYHRKNSPYWWWAAVFNGIRVAQSTKMTSKMLAKKIKERWDFNLMVGETEFLKLSSQSPVMVSDFIRQYLVFIGSRKSARAAFVAKGVLKRFQWKFRRFRTVIPAKFRTPFR